MYRAGTNCVNGRVLVSLGRSIMHGLAVVEPEPLYKTDCWLIDQLDYTSPLS